MNFPKKYFNLKNYSRRLLVEANLRLLGQIERIVAPKSDAPLRHAPIFILGAPRSGSTLIIQVITDALDIGYFTNRHCQFFGAPVVAERLFHTLASRPLSNYQSNYGTTEGAHEPAECGDWWYRFFRRHPSYVTVEDVNPLKMQSFRRSLASIINALDRPIILKNLYASLRIQAIAKYIPESLFIVTHRNEVNNAHSLLAARYERFDDYKPWFSVAPPEIEKLKLLPPHEQVIEQIRQIHATIDQDLQTAAVAYDRRFDLKYEEFCLNPSKNIEAILDFLKSHGCQIRHRHAFIPDRFTPTDKICIDQELYQAMIEYSGRSH